MSTAPQNVGELITQLAVNAFNTQFNTEYDWTLFKIYSLPPNVTNDCAFEIVGTIDNELLVLHIYSEIGRDYYFGQYTLKDDVNNDPSVIEKRYVALARFDDSILFFNNNFIRRSCPTFDPADTRLDCFMDEQFLNGFLSEKGEYLLPEKATSLVDGL